MRVAALALALAVTVVAACARLPTRPVSPWAQRERELQGWQAWQLEGRVAAALGTQGWQATLNWQQDDQTSRVRLAGPFGLGAMSIVQSPDGLSLNGAPPTDAILEQLHAQIGFDLPFQQLHFWLLGVPDPSLPSDLQENPQGRLQQVSQAGWLVSYDGYQDVAGDVLPARLVLTRPNVRVKVIIDHWALRAGT